MIRPFGHLPISWTPSLRPHTPPTCDIVYWAQGQTLCAAIANMIDARKGGGGFDISARLCTRDTLE